MTSIAFVRVSSADLGIERLRPECDEFFRAIKNDFSAVATATRPIRHVESLQIRSAMKSILPHDHVARELSRLDQGHNVLFVLEGSEAISTNVEGWR